MTTSFVVDYTITGEDDVYKNHKFLLEIDPDGMLLFPDYDGDINYDILAESLGEDPTWPIEFLQDWNRDAMSVICIFMDLPLQYYVLLAADWAEHILPILNKAIDLFADGFTYKKVKERFSEHKNKIVNTIESSRTAAENVYNKRWVLKNKSIHNKTLQETKRSTNFIFNSTDSMTIENGSLSVTSAGDSAQHLIEFVALSKITGEYIHKSNMQRELDRLVKQRMRDAATHAITTIINATRNDKIDVDAEREWQVRHFIHAMECVQAGKDWPSIKETP